MVLLQNFWLFGERCCGCGPIGGIVGVTVVSFDVVTV